MRLNQPRFRAGVDVGATSWPNMPAARRGTRRSKMTRRFMSGLTAPKAFWVAKFLSNPLSIGMRTLCVFALCLVFALADGVAKQRHCTFRVHAQANSQDTEVFATSVRGQISGKNVA